MAKALEPLFLVNNNLTEFAKEDFCTAVLEKLVKGSPAGGAIGILPCLKEIKPVPNATEVYRGLCDPKKFPDFHDLENGMMGTYQKFLRSLNTEVTTPALIGAGIFDPSAVAPLFDIEPPALDDLPSLDDIMLAFKDPLKMIELLNIDLTPLKFAAKLGELSLSLPVPPKLPIPEIPSPELFELGLDFVPPEFPDTGLVSFQLRSFTVPIKALIGLLPKIQDIALGGFLPSAFGDALCSSVSSGFPIKPDRPIEAAAHAVMIERSVTAVATAAVAQQLGAGGAVCKTVFEATGGPTQDRLKERIEGLKKDDEAQHRNDIPKNRGLGISKYYKDKGVGLKTETYLKIKEIGATFIDTDTALDGSKLNDNYKGLIMLCVLHHETGIDPGSATTSGSGKTTSAKEGEYPDKGFTDTQVWGMNVVNTAGLYDGGLGPTSMTKDQFQKSPVWDPENDVIKGMPIQQQLEYYQQYLVRMLTVVLNKNEKLGKGQKKLSPYGLAAYTGVRPVLASKLIKKYTDQKITDGNPYTMTLKDCPASPRKKGNTRPYPFQNIYDVYGFHQGFQGTASNGYGEWLKNLRIPYTIAERTFQMIQKVEHIDRYMKVVGMDKNEGINWDKIIVGLTPYLEKGGLYAKKKDNKPIFPIDDGNDKIAGGRDRWTKGQRSGGTDKVANNMSGVLDKVKASFASREENIAKGGGFKPPNVTFNPSY